MPSDELGIVDFCKRINILQLKERGYEAIELHHLGYSVSDLKKAGYPLSDFVNIYDKYELLECYSMKEIIIAGYDDYGILRR